MIASRWPAWLGLSATVVAWFIGAVIVAQRTTLGIEESRAAYEGQLVAVALQAGRSAPATVRALMAAGSLGSVRRTMERDLGSAAQRIGIDDRAVVLGSSGERYRHVVQPVKDADDWDIVGAVVLRVDAWLGAGTVVTIAGIAALLALLQGLLALRRLAEADYTGGHIAMSAAGLAMALGTLALVVRGRLELLAASRALPPPRQGIRFDPSVIPLPQADLMAVEQGALLLLGLGLVLAIGWLASARRGISVTREALAAWGFLSPSLLHLAVFTLAPLCFTLYVSFHDWDLLTDARPFVALANYRELGHDRLFWTSLRNTALYSLYVPVSMVLALGMAMALNQPLRGIRVLRAIVFLPTVVSLAAIAVAWQWMFNGDYGILNRLLQLVGIEAVDWLANPRAALVAVMLVSAWVQVGYQMVIYLAGLQGIPATLHEAAALDGASPWQRFTKITIPLLRPVTVYLFVTGIIWSFQVFTLVYVMTEGGPVHATDVLVYRIYQNAWEFRRMGYASAMSWVLFALLALLTLAQWRIINRRVDHAT